jgi:HEAT repeat protein
MDDDDVAPGELVRQVTEGPTEAGRDALATLAKAPVADRKATTRELREIAEKRPGALAPALPALADLLTDEERAIRLRTAKLFVAVARAEPGAAVATVERLAERLADEEEFYYVRARSAEALGYVALEHPDSVASPETLADLRVGLEFDEPEVKEKLAKALEYVALGDPDRLRHQVERLAEHVDDDGDLVRYHLCTALVAVGCAHPERLAETTEELGARLDDPEPQVRGRAAEALGLVAGSGADVDVPAGTLAALVDDEPFVAERARFAHDQSSGEDSTEQSDADPDDPSSVPFGTLDGIRESTESAVDELTSPDVEGECPHCGLELPEQGPPMCPRCGAPR